MQPTHFAYVVEQPGGVFTGAHDQESADRSIAITMLPPPVEYPPCHCPTPTPWDERRDDGAWPEDMYDVLMGDEPAPRLLQRTCPKCGASKCIEVQS